MSRNPSTPTERRALASIGQIFSGFPTYRQKHGSLAIPFVSIRDLDHVGEHYWPLSSLQVSDTNRLDRFRLVPGDVLITSRGTTLKCCVTPEGWNGAVLASNLIAIRVGQSLRPELLAEFLNSRQGRQAIERRLAGSNLLILTPKSLADVEVPVPPLDEQEKLVELIKASEEQYQTAVSAAENRRQIVRRIILSALNGSTKRMEEESESR